MPPSNKPSQRKTVRVRVCIVVNPDGTWCAVGEDHQDERWHVMSVGDSADFGAVFYWAYMTVPIPHKAAFSFKSRGNMEEISEFGRTHLNQLQKLADSQGKK